MKNSKSRYKHKLNMLRPGAVICSIIGIIAVIALALYIFGIKKAAVICFVVDAVIVLVLFILLCVEQHQDKMLYQDAKRENKDIK